MSIDELLKDEALVEQVKAATSLEEVVELFYAKGIELNTDELKAALRAEEGELDEIALDSVTGGRFAVARLIRTIVPFLHPIPSPIIGFKK